MNLLKIIKSLRDTPVIGLLITIFISSALLILINYYTLRTMSAVRAYINGESYYSKGEKNATLNLISYLNTHEEADWKEFMTNIKIPFGDSLARTILLNGGDEKLAKQGFIDGLNHVEDIDNMIWLFKRFQNISLMKASIKIWGAGDALIKKKYAIALQIREAVANGITEEQKKEFLRQLNNNIKALSSQEGNFSNTMGAAARKITTYLFYANIFLILMILGSVTVYLYLILKRIHEKNADLLYANLELDRLVYTISHDLRAPITSMMGLVGLAQRETKMGHLSNYFTMMNQALKKQEAFVKETIEMSKQNRATVKKEIIDLSQLIDQIISLYRHMPEAEGIEFKVKIGVYRIFSDKHRLEVILNNLISNAIKYHDPQKPNQYIVVTTSSQLDKIKIEIEDNGIGIEAQDHSKVFDMFYVSNTQGKGSGLGLYIVNEMATKIGGKVVMQSKREEGSTFSVILPK